MENKKRKTIITGLVAVLFCTLSVQAVQVYQVDFNTASGGPATGWNLYAAPGDVTGTLSDTAGDSSAGVTISGGGANFADSTGSGLYNASTAPTWVPSTAGDDFFWTGNDTANELSFTVTFGGLTAGDDVSLDVFASRRSSLALLGYYEYSLDGGSSWSGFGVLENDGTAATTDGWDSNGTQSQLFNLDETGGYASGRYMNISGVTLTGTSLNIRLTSPATDSNYAGINAMRLTTPDSSGATNTYGSQVIDAGFSGSVTPGTPENITGDAVLTQLTTDEGTFTNLVGATAQAVVTANILNSVGSAPATADEAVSGLTVNDGVNNMQAGYFQFPNGFDADTRFFILETTPQSAAIGDDVTVTFVDANNAAVSGTQSLSLSAPNFTSSPADTTDTSLATVTYTVTQATPIQKQGAVWFSLADFTGTGDLSSATGIRLASIGLDPVVVGIYSLSGTFPPEPEPPLPAVQVLFVGNSYTHGSFDPLLHYNSSAITDLNGTGYGGVPGMFKQLTVSAGLNYNVFIEAVSGQTLAYHLSSRSNLIFQAQWDQVILQEHSKGALPVERGGSLPAFQAAAIAIEQGIHAANPYAKVLLYETFPRSGMIYVPGEAYYGESVETMVTDLHNGYYGMLNLDPDFTAVSPAGDAWLEAILSGVADRNPYNGIDAGKVNLWASDNHHASAYGCYLNTLVHFGTITGIDPRALGYEQTAMDLGISSNIAVNLQQEAYDTLTGNGAKPVLILSGTADYTVEVGSGYTDPGASAYDVLDGSITPVAVYNDVISGLPGTYTVRWEAINSQGLTGTVTRVVNVIPSDKPILSAIGATNGNFTLNISNMASGQMMAIERNLFLTNSPWTSVHSFTATGPATNYSEAATNIQSFFRAVAQ
jgi:hypothetical protein